MEIKEQLLKPYTADEKLNFIVEYNHNQGLEIKETDVALEAWGYTQEELDKFEEERIKKLKLTKREVFLALYQHKNITPEEIKAQIQDKTALIEFEYANEYYRGNPLIDEIGNKLGLKKEEMDYLFQYGKFEQD